MKEINRVHDLPARMVHVTLQDDLGGTHEWHISVMKDGCPMCGCAYIKTQAGVVDVDATVQTMIEAIVPEIQKATAAFVSAGSQEALTIQSAKQK